MRYYSQHKLDFHMKICIFFRYSDVHRGYRCLRESRKNIVSRHIEFNESGFPYLEMLQKQTQNINIDHPNLSLLVLVNASNPILRQPEIVLGTTKRIKLVNHYST